MSYLSYDSDPTHFSSVTISNLPLQIFLALQIFGGLVLLPLLLLTFLFSKSTPRDATLNNLLFCFILIALGSSFSLVTGNPALMAVSRNWCVAQSILIYTALPMTGTASCGMALNISGNLYLAIYRPPWGSRWRKCRYSIVLAPYVVGAVFAIAAALVAGLFPASVSMGVPVFTCTFIGHDFVNITLLYTGSTLTIQFLIQIAIFIALFRNWRIIRTRQNRLHQQTLAYIRISTFSIWATLSGVAALISVWSPLSPIPGLISATDPLAAFLIFGTQRDVVSVWRFCGSRKRRDFDQLFGESEKTDIASSVRRHSV